MLRAALLAALLPLALPAAAQGDDPLVEAREPRAELGEGGTVRVFAILENRGEAPAELVELRSEVGEMATLVAAPAATPRAVPETLGGLILPPGVETTLEPDGIHILLSGAPETLAEGDEVAVTLVFEPGAEVELRAPLEAPPAD